MRPSARYLHWASNATLDRPVDCQMAKLEQIKALKYSQFDQKKVGGGLRCNFEQQLWTLYAITDN